MATDGQGHRIFVVDDHEAVRDGLRTLIDGSDDLRVVGEASCVAEARARIPATRPALVLLDLRLPDSDEFTACSDILASLSGVRVLVLTATSDPESQRHSRQAGASGYVVKSARRNEILGAIRRVLAGELVFDDPDTTTPPARGTEYEPDVALVDGLTDDERTILELIVDGRTNQRIAAELGLSEKTVKKQISAIFAKLGVSTRVGAAVVATRAARARHPASGATVTSRPSQVDLRTPA